MPNEISEVLQEMIKSQPQRQAAMRRAVQKAIRYHKFMGVPIVVWKDGKVVEIPPEEIVLRDEPNDAPTEIWAS